jgi:hypothetical protein
VQFLENLLIPFVRKPEAVLDRDRRIDTVNPIDELIAELPLFVLFEFVQAGRISKGSFRSRGDVMKILL